MLRHHVLAALLLCCLGAWIALLWLQHVYGEKPYSMLEDRLYVGGLVSAPPPGTRAVVNLCEQKDPYEVEDQLWEPIDGGKAPSLDWLRRVVEFIDARRRAGATTYVHCLAGMNRSGMVVTAYLMYEHDWDREQALAFVRSRRPEVQPNPSMMRFLAEWERDLNPANDGLQGPRR